MEQATLCRAQEHGLGDPSDNGRLGNSFSWKANIGKLLPQISLGVSWQRRSAILKNA